MKSGYSHTQNSRSFLSFSFSLCSGLLGIFFIILFLLYVVGQSKNHAQQQQVLGEADIVEIPALGNSTAGLFIVNVPATFNNDISAPGRTLDLGDGTIIAANIISSLLQGEGIAVLGSGQSLTVANTDRGSDQAIFKSIQIGDERIQAASNTDSLVFEAGEGLSLSVVNGKVVIAAASTGKGESGSPGSSSPQSGFIDSGNTVSLQDASDRVVLGAASAEAKLHVVGGTDTPGLVIEALDGQQANLSEWRGPDGNPLIYFDNEGNAVFNGNITQNGSQINGDTVAFTGSGSTLVLDVQTDEPFNYLDNPDFENGLESWISNAPSVVNQTVNGNFTTNLDGWTGTMVGAAFPELFSNTGFESDTASWNISGGGLYRITDYPVLSSTPYYITSGPDGNMWYTTTGNKIGKVTASGLVTEYTTPSSINIGQITSGPDGNVWYISSATNKVGKVTSAGVVTEYTVSAGGGGITTGPDGNIWYTLPGVNKVGKMTPNGVVLQEYTFPSATGPKEIVAGPDGNVWVTFETGNRVGKITTAGDLTIVTTTGSQPRGITVGPDNNIWYVTFGAREVGRITPAGTVTTFTSPVTANFDITAGSDGNLWLTETGARKLTKVSVNGVFTEYGATAESPRGIAAGPDGNIWYVAEAGNKVGVLNLQGPERITTTTFASTNGSLQVPSNSEPALIQQSINTGNSREYTLTAHVYIDGNTPVTAAAAQLVVNGSTVTTSYTPVGGGWYLLTAAVTGSNTAVPYGVRVAANRSVVVDTFSLKAASSAERVVSPSFSDIGSAFVAASSDTDMLFSQTVSFSANAYTLTGYVYTNGSAVSNSDIVLFYNGNQIPSTFTATGSPGWYRVQGAFTGSNWSHAYGLRVKAGKQVSIDGISLTAASVADAVQHTTNPPKWNNSNGAVRLNAVGRSPVEMSQEIALPTAGTYSFSVRAYDIAPDTEGSSITAADVRLLINGVPVTGASYTQATDSFTTVSASSFLTAGTYTVTVQAQTSAWIVVDAAAFQQGSGNDKTVYILNSGSGLAKLNVESTAILNSGVAENQGLVVVGAAGQIANLSEWKDSNNTIVTVVDEEGRIGVGTGNPAYSLVVSDENQVGAVSALTNTAVSDSPAVGVLKLLTSVDSTGTDTRFLQFYANATDETNGVGVGRIRLNNGGVAYESGGADFAEYFRSERNSSEYSPGDIMVLTKNGTAGTTVDPRSAAVIGVVTDTAAFVGNAKEESATDEGQVLIGLLGQIKTTVSTANGSIEAGDPISASSISGAGIKAEPGSPVIGIAMEPFDDSFSGKPCTEEEPSSWCGRIRVYVNPGWYGGSDAVSVPSALNTPTEVLEDTTTLDGLAVIGNTNLYSLSVTDSITSGLLTITGLNEKGGASIDTLTGALELQSLSQGAISFLSDAIVFQKNGDVEIREGVLYVSKKMSGKSVLMAGESEVQVSMEWANPPSAILLTPGYDTGAWVEDITRTGFTIKVKTPPEQNQDIYWFASFTYEE